jgi:hypothetical protein
MVKRLSPDVLVVDPAYRPRPRAHELGLRNNAELARFAVKHGYVTV